MKRAWLTPILAILIVFIFTAACSSGASSPTPAATAAQDGATLLAERCSVCHPLTFVEKSHHTAADWKLIVGMMVSRGAKLSSAEETVVVNYLAANFGQ